MVVTSPRRPGSAEEVRADVARIVARAIGIAAGRSLPPQEPLAALGLDSLALVNAVAAVEAAYECELPDALWEDRGGISIASLAAALAETSADAVRTSQAASASPAQGEQPGVSRMERLFTRLEGRGIASRAVAGVLHSGVIGAHWAHSRQPCVLLARDLEGDLPEVKLPPGIAIARFDGSSDAPLDDIWTVTQAARMRAHLHRRMESGVICLAAWEGERIVAYDLLGPAGSEDVTASNGTCLGLNLYERREARGRGIGLALLAASLPYTRELGFTRQATIVLERNRPMIAAATQILGFAVIGRAERSELLGRVRWSWRRHGSVCQGPRLVV
jgi:GNAT superfamily N-acetyltransferase/acyl carrier protein